MPWSVIIFMRLNPQHFPSSDVWNYKHAWTLGLSVKSKWFPSDKIPRKLEKQSHTISFFLFVFVCFVLLQEKKLNQRIALQFMHCWNSYLSHLHASILGISYNTCMTIPFDPILLVSWRNEEADSPRTGSITFKLLRFVFWGISLKYYVYWPHEPGQEDKQTGQLISNIDFKVITKQQNVFIVSIMISISRY